MKTTTSSRVTVRVEIEAGVWVVTTSERAEVTVTVVEVLFTDGNPYSCTPFTVRRNKSGEWGKASGGYYHISKFAHMPAGLRREVLAAYHAHLQTINATAETYGEKES